MSIARHPSEEHRRAMGTRRLQHEGRGRRVRRWRSDRTMDVVARVDARRGGRKQARVGLYLARSDQSRQQALAWRTVEAPASSEALQDTDAYAERDRGRRAKSLTGRAAGAGIATARCCSRRFQGVDIGTPDVRLDDGTARARADVEPL